LIRPCQGRISLYDRSVRDLASEQLSLCGLATELFLKRENREEPNESIVHHSIPFTANWSLAANPHARNSFSDSKGRGGIKLLSAQSRFVD
jgi:hypothetical protein